MMWKDNVHLGSASNSFPFLSYFEEADFRRKEKLWLALAKGSNSMQ